MDWWKYVDRGSEYCFVVEKTDETEQDILQY